MYYILLAIFIIVKKTCIDKIISWFILYIVDEEERRGAMNKKRLYELSDEEYKILCFYRELPEHKKDKYKELLISLRKVLIDDKDEKAK